MLRASSDWEAVILKPVNLKRQLNSCYQVLWSNFLSLNFYKKGEVSPHFTIKQHAGRGILFLEYSLNDIFGTAEINTLFLMICKTNNLV